MVGICVTANRSLPDPCARLDVFIRELGKRQEKCNHYRHSLDKNFGLLNRLQTRRDALKASIAGHPIVQVFPKVNMAETIDWFVSSLEEVMESAASQSLEAIGPAVRAFVNAQDEEFSSLFDHLVSKRISIEEDRIGSITARIAMTQNHINQVQSTFGSLETVRAKLLSLCLAHLEREIARLETQEPRNADLILSLHTKWNIYSQLRIP